MLRYCGVFLMTITGKNVICVRSSISQIGIIEEQVSQVFFHSLMLVYEFVGTATEKEHAGPQEFWKIDFTIVVTQIKAGKELGVDDFILGLEIFG